MAKIRGSLWVSGNTLRFCDEFDREWSWAGVFVANQAAVPGSIWIESTYIRFINEAGTAIYHVDGPLQTALGGLAGSLWVESNFLFWIDEAGGRRLAHHDVVHQDGGGVSSHVDHTDQVAHTDIPPGAHVDVPHYDQHTDNPHADSHTDTHTDVPHSDTHYDMHGDHSALNHSDCTIYQNGVIYSHGDFQDAISPGPYYCMWHDDHTDGSAHIDAHSDVPHQDAGHQDHEDNVSHSDVPAGTHGDVPHGDVPHVDHTDAAHADVPHVDNPILIGP